MDRHGEIDSGLQKTYYKRFAHNCQCRILSELCATRKQWLKFPLPTPHSIYLIILFSHIFSTTFVLREMENLKLSYPYIRPFCILPFDFLRLTDHSYLLTSVDPLEKEKTTLFIIFKKFREQRSLAGYSPWSHKRVEQTFLCD